MKRHFSYPDILINKFAPYKVKTVGHYNLFGAFIPNNTVSDGASVPWFLWWFMDPLGFAFPAALVHDYQCRESKTWEDRKLADERFRVNLINIGASNWYARLAWFGVRIGAWYDLRKNKNSDD